MSIRTSDIDPTAAAAGPNDTIIALVEVEPGTFRLRRVPVTYFDGPQGEPGTNGTDGGAGTNGTNGTNGAAGTPGSVWREGTGAPANGLGVDGDFYLNDANGDVYQKAAGVYAVVANIQGVAGTNGSNGTNGTNAAFQLGFAASDETTDLTTGMAKITLRAPSAATITAVRASINTASSAGIVTVDIYLSGVTMLSTKLTIDVGEETSTTAAVPPVISDSSLADDEEITVEIVIAGTGAKGLKIWLLGTF